MKKLLAWILTAVLVLSALSVLPLTASAEEAAETSFKYGNADVELTLIEDCTSITADTYLGWGTITSDGEMMVINTDGAQFTDAYGIRSEMLNKADLSGAKNIVFSIKNNRTDGDFFFTFQPHDPNVTGFSGNIFTGWVEDAPLLLVDKDGKCMTAAKAPSLAVATDRAAYVIPWGFEGYLVFPVAAFANHGDWTNSYYVDGRTPVLDAMGFHVQPDDATYIEFSIDDIFVCGELPTYEAPAKETDAPTEPVTAAPTDPVTEPETDPATEPETDPETDPETTAPTDPTTEPTTELEEPAIDNEGCASVLVGLSALPIIALGAAVVLRKRED